MAQCCMTQKTRKSSVPKLAVTELISQVSAQSGLTRSQSKAAVNAALDSVIAHLRNGHSVGLPGLGVFKIKDTSERQGIRPGTSEPMTIPAGRKVSFTVAAPLKQELNR